MEKKTFNAPEVEIIRYDEEAITTTDVGASLGGSLNEPTCGINE